MTALNRFPKFRRLVLALGVVVPTVADAQDQRDEQFYYPGSFNWTFLKRYPEGARLFNAFDYGHAVLYERLYTQPTRAAEALEREYRFLTTDLLVNPPRFAVAEEAIEPTYAKIAWQAKQMFDWAHLLHRQIYDVYADERIPPAERAAMVERLTDYYLTRKAYAFTPVPKSMALMDDQYFSQVFRKRHPQFNGLIWAYHWLQVGLYEPLMLGTTPAEKKAGVKATLARFWSMLEQPPAGFPRVMPMTSAIAPTFSAKHPRAAVIFDNLHMMHDIISDVLAADTIPKDRKRAVIYEQLAEFRNGTRNVMSMEEWRDMATMMGGLPAMGGPATGLLVARVPDSGMAGMDHGAKAPKAASDTAMAGMHHDPKRPEAAGDSATRTPMADMVRPMVDPAQHPHESAPSDGDEPMATMMALHRRMMADPMIQRRVFADTAMRRMMTDMMEHGPPEHREHMAAMMKAAPVPKPSPPRIAPRKPPTRPKKPVAPPPPVHHAPPGAKHF